MIRDLLVTNHSKFMKGRALQRAKGLCSAKGLLTSEERVSFASAANDSTGFSSHANCNEYAKAMIEFSAKKYRANGKDGDVRDIDKEMMRLTLWIVGKTLFSANVRGRSDAGRRSDDDDCFDV